MKLPEDRMCFACGEDNPISLGLQFSRFDVDKVRAEFTPDKEHQGFDDIMHGGLISTLLDEAMAKVIYLKGVRAVTAEFRVRFKEPVFIGEKLEIVGELIKERGKLYYTEAVLRNQTGELKAVAEAKFLKMKEDL